MFIFTQIWSLWHFWGSSLQKENLETVDSNYLTVNILTTGLRPFPEDISSDSSPLNKLFVYFQLSGFFILNNMLTATLHVRCSVSQILVKQVTKTKFVYKMICKYFTLRTVMREGWNSKLLDLIVNPLL